MLPADVIGPVRVGLMFIRLFTHTATTYNNGFGGLFIPFHYVTSSICGGGPLMLDGKSLKSTMHTSVDFPFIFGPVRVSDALTCSNNVCGGFPASIVQRSFRPSIVVNDIMTTGPNGPGRGSLVDRLRGVVVRGASCSVPSSLNVIVAFGCSSIGLLSFSHLRRLRSVNCGHALGVVSSVGDHIRHEIGTSGIHLEHLIFQDGLPRFHFQSVVVRKTGTRRRTCVGGRFRSRRRRIFACRSLGHKCFHLLTSGVVSRVIPRTICSSRSSLCRLRLGIGVRSGFSIHLKNDISAADSGRVCLKVKCRGLGCCSGRVAFSNRLNGVCGGTRLVNGVSLPARVSASFHFVTSVDAFSCCGGSGLFSEGSGPSFGSGSRHFIGLVITLPFLTGGHTRFDLKCNRLRSGCFRSDMVSFSGSHSSEDACGLLKNSVNFCKDALGAQRCTAGNCLRGLVTRMFAKEREFRPKGPRRKCDPSPRRQRS